MNIEIYDTTLRDGSQQEGISLTVDDKLRVARLLDQLGVAYVEGGWPGANPKDTEFFRRAKSELAMASATLTAFGSTRRPGTPPERDAQLRALLEAETEVVCLVGKASAYHVKAALGVEKSEALAMVGDSVEFLRERGHRVFFDAEHFFDGFDFDSDYALEVLRVARDSGAERLVLCDTNGGTLPSQARARAEAAASLVGWETIGVHFHNDAGTAVAASIDAAEMGARQIQGCINGYGERTGNADLSTLIPDLQVKMGLEPIKGDLGLLTNISHHIAEIVNVTLEPHRPYVGGAAFTHKAGLHSSALVRDPNTYEHEDPTVVGNRRRLLVSELAGRAAVVSKAEELGLGLAADEAATVVARVKELEADGYQFEAADGSLELLIRKLGGWENTFFEVEEVHVVSASGTEADAHSSATVRLRVAGEVRVSGGEGVGPVEAVDHALRDALRHDYPGLEEMRLTDYRVRVLDSKDGTSAVVRVLIDTSDRETTWGTIGVHQNIIEASVEALVDGITVGLLRMAA